LSAAATSRAVIDAFAISEAGPCRVPVRGGKEARQAAKQYGKLRIY